MTLADAIELDRERVKRQPPLPPTPEQVRVVRALFGELKLAA
ncbi:hypothetical protein [Streptomyces phage phiScoe45]|nr:hypothetical protein [Streptomyces phage phiScoe45]